MYTLTHTTDISRQDTLMRKTENLHKSSSQGRQNFKRTSS